MIKRVKRILITIGGGTVLLIGVALIVLPGPALIVIPAGLAILALEFAWARRLLRSARALMPRRAKDDRAARKKLTLQSVRRSTSFLFRQVTRTLFPKSKNS